MAELDKKEMEVLIDVLQALDASFHKDEDAQADYMECDENMVYITMSYAEGEDEDLKLDRSALSSGKKPKEIAEYVW